MKRKTFRSNLLAACAGGSFILTAQHASAASQTWDGSSSGDWAVGANWVGNAVPGSTTVASTDVATFLGTGVSNFAVNLGNAQRFIGTIDFNSATSYTINLYDTDLTTERKFTVGSGGIDVALGNHIVAGSQVTAAALALANGTDFNIASDASLELNARLGGGTSFNFSKSGGGTLIISGSNGGSGAWRLDGTTGFTVSAGTLKLASSGASGFSGNKFLVSAGATIELAAAGALQVGSAASTTLNGNGVSGVGALHASATTSIGGSTGTVILASNSRIGVDAAQTLTIARDITGTGALEKSGSGTLTLGGTNSYTGDTLVSAGTLFVNGSLASGSDVTVTSTGTIGGTGTIASTLTFDSGANLDLTGATLGLTSAGILTVAAGQTMTFSDFQFTDIVGWDWANAASGTYTLINGGGTVSFGPNTPTIDEPYAFGNGKLGYFQQGSLQAVIIPEPAAALLGSLGMFFLLRRRRQT